MGLLVSVLCHPVYSQSRSQTVNVTVLMPHYHYVRGLVNKLPQCVGNNPCFNFRSFLQLPGLSSEERYIFPVFYNHLVAASSQRNVQRCAGKTELLQQRIRSYTYSNTQRNGNLVPHIYFLDGIQDVKLFLFKILKILIVENEKLYRELGNKIEEFKTIAKEENKHEEELIEIIEEEKLQFVGSMVLGLNDALVELTGTLAGLTFALKNTRLIALSGLITGIAATLSMAASEYLSARTEQESSRALKSSLYTGGAYVFTVACLVFPYLLFSNYVLSLVLTIIMAILIILVFNFYISVAKDLPFKQRFFEMAGISLGVAVISFIIGHFVRLFLGVDV